MTNTQLWLATGIPTLAVLIGILLNQFALSDIRARLLGIEGDLQRFYQLIGEHGGKRELLEKKLNS
jgi:hypothetical protein